ncbi:prolyl oligopeptidase [Hypoxylon trugodes]|uniref:prolyl oligopeptidase n=1 Tax=Hypoxylon trugodes TaxID=326681 RepID=UPI00218FC4F7|nr:prolyl oligopeptidase [Hypoxylon trugodes]KAI1394031.1 prolyl oligopeptidase [Hypoxylon trugodes]
MTTTALTPETFALAPIMGPAQPSHDGTRALYTVSRYTKLSGEFKEIWIMEISTGNSYKILQRAKIYNVTWLGDDSRTIIFFNSGSPTEFHAINMANQLSYCIGIFPMSVFSFKTKPLPNGSVAVVAVGEGTEEFAKSPHTAKIYQSANLVDGVNGPRVIDPSDHPETSRDKILYTTLEKNGDEWKFTSPMNDVLLGTSLETSRDGNNYDICENGIVFGARDSTKVNRLMGDEFNIYYTKIHSFAANTNVVSIRIDDSRGFNRLGKHPRFSPDGNEIALIIGSMMKMSDRVFVIPIRDSVEFSPDGLALFVTADDHGRVALYKLSLLFDPFGSGSNSNASPISLLRSNGSVESFFLLRRGNAEELLVSSSSLLESSLYHIISTDEERIPRVVLSATQNGALFGLSPRQISQIEFKGAGDYRVHAWMVTPSSFDNWRRYPLAILVHGGPHLAWNDQWGNNNPVLWAEQGYIVVAPNILGSTDYGNDFIHDIYGDFDRTTLPTQDLMNCTEHLEANPNVDTGNAVIFGHSYGGLLMNWIQGHEFGQRFKSIVCSGGIIHWRRYAGRPYPDDPDDYFYGDDPSQPHLLKEWKTPMLIIHGKNDNTCKFEEGLAAFNNACARNVLSRFVQFDNEGHSIRGRENQVRWFNFVFDWINWYTGLQGGNGAALPATHPQPL